MPGRVRVGKAAGVTRPEAQGTLCRLSSRRSGLMDPSHLTHTHPGLGTRVPARPRSGPIFRLRSGAVCYADPSVHN